MSLARKVAVVTGSSMGIGEAIAKAILKEGAKVVLADVKEPAWEVPENAVHVKCDVSNSTDVQAVISARYKELLLSRNCQRRSEF